MRVLGTPIPGCFEIRPDVRRDPRGSFVKTFREDLFGPRGWATRFAEEYYTVSRRGTLRGLHFQVPPMEHAKVVYCCWGAVTDAVVDLREGSPAFGRFALFDLDPESGAVLYLPPGLAHGFYVRSPEAVMQYKVTSPYSPDHDAGILWNSAGIPWPDGAPTLSDRDRAFPPLSGFTTPFRFPAEDAGGRGRP